MNTKAQISDIDLTPDVDLTESRLDILPYKGIMDCNSPHVGGVLNNVYKKKTATLPEGFHKIVEYKGKVYAWKADTEPNIGCKVYDVTDTANPVVVLDLNSGVAELDALGFHTVKRELYAKPKKTYYIGYLEYNSNGRIMFHSPFRENYSFFVGLIGDCVNYAIVNNVVYISRVRSSNVDYLNSLDTQEYNSASSIINAINCWTVVGNTVTTVQDEYKFLVLGGRVFNHLYNYLTTLEETETILNAVIEEDYFTLETKLTSQTSGTHKIYNLNRDTPGAVDLDSEDFVGIAPQLFPIMVDEDYWKNQYFIHSYVPGHITEDYSFYFHHYKYGNTTVALAINDKVISYEVERVIFKDFENGYTYYLDFEGNIYRLSIVTNEAPQFRVVKGVIISNSINSVYSSYDMDSKTCEEPFFAPSFSLPIIVGGGETTKNVWIGSGNNEQWDILNKKFTSLIFPQAHIIIAQGDNYNYISKFKPSTPYKSNAYAINLYYGEDSPIYQNSRRYLNSNWAIRTEPFLEGIVFPSYSDGNTITPVDMFSIIKDSGNNQLLISNSENKAYVSPKNLIGEPLFGYYNYTETFMDELFVLQTGSFGIDGDFIYNLQLSNSVLTSQEIVATVKDLKFLGAFPLMALFWSKLDKSIYVFTGDNNLKKLKEAYRINTVGAIYCDPARLTMFISTDIGLIVLYQEQVFLLDYPLIEGENKIYYDNGKYIVDDDLIAFSPFENFESQSIRIKTEFYGESRMIKSINDCVFVRITKNSSITSGTVKIKAYTLTEKTSESTEQIYSISEKNFDTSGQCLLQYQPQFQTGVGFSVEVESDFPVAYIGISHQPEAIQQSPKGKQNVIASPVSKPGKNFRFE